VNSLHDPAVREELKTRIGKVTADCQRKWGTMTPDQMLWHLCEPIECALGAKPYGKMMSMPLPGPMIKWMLLNVPWIKGRTPTAPAFEAKGRYDLEAERKRLLGLLDRMAAADVNGQAQLHPMFGNNPMAYQSRLQAKHVRYHLEQFGV
jgi:hypothetical protein